MDPYKFCKCLADILGNDIIVKVADPPPGYISNLKLINQNDPVILVYNEKKRKDNTFLDNICQSNTGLSDLSLADLSITGQPLECPFENDKDDTLNNTTALEPATAPEDYYHVPLSMLEARKCISIVNMNMSPPLPVWVLTDATDRLQSFLLSSEHKIVEGGKWRTTAWVRAHSREREKLPINELLEDFENTFKAASRCKVTSTVSCVYNIKDEPGMAKNSKCFLEANWQRPSYEVPISQADTSLIIECDVGQEESQISRWWHQLTLLHDYVNIIKQRKESNHVQVTYYSDSVKLPSLKVNPSKMSLSERVQVLLSQSDSMSVCQLNSEQDTTSALNTTIRQLLTDEQLKGQDFTDRLWSLLIEADNYKELAECFQLVFKEVRKRSVKPYIFVKNKTRLASLLRNSKTNTLDMELIDPLELLVEIGLEKLKRDYTFIFLASHIATVESLAFPKIPCFSELGGSDRLPAIETNLQWLARVHTVLELISVVHTSMNHAIVVQVTGLALATYLGPESPIPSLLHLINNRTYSLRAAVVTKEVKRFFGEDKAFYKWKLKISATAETFEASSTYVLLEDSVFPEMILMKLVVDNSLDNTAIMTESFKENNTVMYESNMNIQKYSYMQLCSVAYKYPN